MLRIRLRALLTLMTLLILAVINHAYALPEFGRAVIAPTLVTLETGESRQFKVTILPKRLQPARTPGAIEWSVNGIPGGNALVGTIDEDGVYRAPMKVPVVGEIHVQAAVPEATNAVLSATVLIEGGEYEYTSTVTWSAEEISKSGLQGPRSVAIDSKGNILIAAMQRSQVLQFSKDGRFVGNFGRNADGNAVPHENMTMVSVDTAGRVFMGDRMTGPPRVSVFDADGDWLFGFAPKGVSPWMVADPSGLESHPNGSLYLADMDAMRVAVFDENGKYVRVLRESYPAGGQFNAPSDIGIDAAGDLFVASLYGPCEKVHPDTGERLTAFALPSPPDGLLYIDDIFVDRWGDVFLAVRINADLVESGPDFGGTAKVLKYNNNGDFITELTLSAQAPGRTAVAVDSEGQVFVAYSQGQGNDQVAGVVVFKR